MYDRRIIVAKTETGLLPSTFANCVLVPLKQSVELLNVRVAQPTPLFAELLIELLVPLI